MKLTSNGTRSEWIGDPMELALVQIATAEMLMLEEARKAFMRLRRMTFTLGEV